MLHSLFHTVLQQGGGDVFGGLLGLLHAAAHADAVGGGLKHGQVVGAVTDGQGFGLRNIQGFQQLRILRLAHLLSVIFSCEISTRISVLHLGQYSGKLHITVSSCTFVRVLHPQIGQ